MACPAPTNTGKTTTEVAPPGAGHPLSCENAHHENKPESGDDNSPSNETADDQAPKPQPMQKRRRVTRACDACRRRKIKCDGKQPCTHCIVYSYKCTYDQPSNLIRKTTPQYIEALETQLKRAKALLHVVFPTIDLNDHTLDAHLQSGLLPQLLVTTPRQQANLADPRMAPSFIPLTTKDGSDLHLEAMVKATGQLDLDEEGNWHYHGHSSGVSFMSGLRQFGDMFQIPADSSPLPKHRFMSQASSSLYSPQSIADSSATLPTAADLPSKEEAIQLCNCAIIDASAMLRVVHLPTFHKQLNRVYDITPEQFGNAEISFLPLLFAVLSLGKIFPADDQDLDKASYKTLIDEGFKYFRAARQLVDITDCRDLITLQAIVFMIQFLQSSAELSLCYAYIGIALRSGLRMGLHRSFNTNFTPIEIETRKRVFWVLRRMDAYVGAMLGLPRFSEDENIDQEYPAEVDDEYITETAILPMPQGKISVMAAFNAHIRIVQLLSKICKYVYPIKGTQAAGKSSATYKVGYSRIRELEQDLSRWLYELPAVLKPGGKAPPVIIRVQQMLRMAFGHTQLLLYRPFLHYISLSNEDKVVDQRAYALASACVSISRNIVHISAEMQRRGVSAEAYWFSMYTTFFAIVSILYFVLENPTNPTSFELLRDAVEGKEVLAYYSKSSMAADRCSIALKNMFDRLPESIKHGSEIIECKKKRRQGNSSDGIASKPTSFKHDELMGPCRAIIFPGSGLDAKRSTLSHSLPISRSHFASLGLDPGYSSPTRSSPDFFDTVPGLTPTSSTASLAGFNMAPSHPQQRASFPPTALEGEYVDPTDLHVQNTPSLMFPYGDPLAYPSQPMTNFENRHPQPFDRNSASPAVGGLPQQVGNIDPKLHSTHFGASGHNIEGQRRAENENQLFGHNPMPVYLMQDQQPLRAYQPNLGSPNGQLPDNNLQLDDIMNQEESANSFLDPALGLSDGQPARYAQPGWNMGGWR